MYTRYDYKGTFTPDLDTFATTNTINSIATLMVL